MIEWLIGWMQIQRGQVTCLLLSCLMLGWSWGRITGQRAAEKESKKLLEALSKDKVNILYTRALEEQITYLHGMVRKGQAYVRGQDGERE